VKRLAKNKKGKVVCIFRYWIYYVGPSGCIIVHLPLTTVGVCVDPVVVGQVYAGGVDGNVHVSLLSSFTVRVLPGIPRHVLPKLISAPSPALASIVAVHVSSVGVAVMPPMTGGWHVDDVGGVGGVGGVTVTVVLPSGQVSATVQADCDRL
jgi:hypothetical protein